MGVPGSCIFSLILPRIITLVHDREDCSLGLTSCSAQFTSSCHRPTIKTAPYLPEFTELEHVPWQVPVAEDLQSLIPLRSSPYWPQGEPVSLLQLPQALMLEPHQARHPLLCFLLHGRISNILVQCRLLHKRDQIVCRSPFLSLLSTTVMIPPDRLLLLPIILRFPLRPQRQVLYPHRTILAASSLPLLHKKGEFLS